MQSLTSPKLERGCAKSNLEENQGEVEGKEMEMDLGVQNDSSFEEDPEEEPLTEDETVPVTYQDNDTIQILSEDEYVLPMSPSFKKVHPNNEDPVGGGDEKKEEKPEVKSSIWDEEIKGMPAFDHTKCGNHGTPQTPGVPPEPPLIETETEKDPVYPSEQEKKDAQIELEIAEEVQNDIKSDDEDPKKGKETKGTFQVGKIPGFMS